MVGLPNPRNTSDVQSHTGPDRRLTNQLKTYDIEDPPVKREKTAPLRIIHSIVDLAATTFNPKTRHVANLTQLGFYFCLRLREYTKCTGHRQTVQFRSLLEFLFFIGIDSYQLMPQLSTSRMQIRSEV